MSEHETVVLLTEPAALDASVVGSKAAGLASLRREGFCVPDGLVLTADADLDLAESMVEKYLGDRPLAVRSSSTAEDLASSSYAGQYRTVLHVRGASALRQAIQDVRASAKDAVGRGYGRVGEMAVLVMPMLRPTAAGVAFSVDPVTGATQVVVDAVRGVAEELVSGAVSPDRWIVRDQIAMACDQSSEAITAPDALKIARIVTEIARVRGCPQDVEWALEGGEVRILQARPITALPIPIEIQVPSEQTWLREDDHFGRPMRPLEFDLVTSPTHRTSKIVFEELGFPIERIDFRQFGGWPYVRMVPPMDPGKDSPKSPPAWLFGLVLRLVPPLRKRLRRAAQVLAEDIPERLREQWEVELRAECRAQIRHAAQVDRAALSDADLAAHFDDVIALVELTTLHHQRLSGVTYIQWGRLGVFCRDVLGWEDADTHTLLQGHALSTREGGDALSTLAEAIAQAPSGRDLVGHRADALLADRGPAGEALRAYLAEHGHEVVGFDLTHPSHAEDPRPLLTLVQTRWQTRPVPVSQLAARAEAMRRVAHEALDDRPELRAKFETLLERARSSAALGDETEMTMMTPLGLVRYTVVEAARRWVRRGLLPDVDAVFFLDVEEIRRAFRDEAIEAPIERRRGEFRWAFAHPGPRRYGPAPAPMPSLRFVPGWCREYLTVMAWAMERLQPEPADTPQEEARWRGVPASAGRAEGRVRIVREPSEFSRVEPGDIVVCRTTWAAWSVVFPLLSGIVTELGGPLSHPAILAREFGIPAVLGVEEATSRLRDGQRIRIDGAAGRIEVLEASDGAPQAASRDSSGGGTKSTAHLV